MPAARKAPAKKPRVTHVVKREITVPLIAALDRYGNDVRATNIMLVEQKGSSLSLSLPNKEVFSGFVISDTVLGELVEVLKEKPNATA